MPEERPFRQSAETADALAEALERIADHDVKPTEGAIDAYKMQDIARDVLVACGIRDASCPWGSPE